MFVCIFRIPEKCCIECYLGFFKCTTILEYNEAVHLEPYILDTHLISLYLFGMYVEVLVLEYILMFVQVAMPVTCLLLFANCGVQHKN